MVEVRPFNDTSMSDRLVLRAVDPPTEDGSSLDLNVNLSSDSVFGTITIGSLDDGVPYFFSYAFFNCAGEPGGEPLAFSPVSANAYFPFPAADACSFPT